MLLTILLITFSVPIGAHDNTLLTTDFSGSILLCNQDTISTERGSGRNVVSAGNDLFWKECPVGENQRITNLNNDAIFNAEYFSGPYPFENGLLISVPDEILILSYAGSITNSYSIGEYPGSLTSSNEFIWFVSSETGELKQLDITTEQISTVNLPFTPTSVQYRNNYLLLCCSSGDYRVVSLSSEDILSLKNAFFAYFSDENEISFVRHKTTSGCETIEWESARFNIETGEELVISKISEPPFFSNSISSTDDPDAHFDVPYMHQRWDTPDWFDGSWSCGPTSCMMATQYYNRLTPDSIWCSSPTGHWSEWGNYIPTEYTFLGYTYDILGESPDEVWVPGAHGFICRGYHGAGWNEMVSWLSQHGLASQWLGTTWSGCTSELNNSWAVVASTTSPYTGGHILLFNGYYSNHSVICNDSYGNQNLPGWGTMRNGKDVVYDWPGYNNGNTMLGISQLFAARSEPLATANELIDDRSLGYRKLGPSQYWHEQETGYNGYSWWTYSTAALPDTCWVEWNPDLPSEAWYNVETFIPSSHATATGIYHINTTSGWVTASINQNNYSNEWVEIGAFNLLPSSAQVKMGDYTGTGGQYISFDAIRFTIQTSINEENILDVFADFSVSQNPATSASPFFFNLPDNFEGSVKIFDMNGRLVLTTQSQVPVDTVSPGIYYAVINDHNKINSIRFTVIK